MNLKSCLLLIFKSGGTTTNSALRSNNFKDLTILYVDANDSWKYTLDAIVTNLWLFKVPELEMTRLQLVSLLISWIFRIYFLEGKVCVL
jgi:hypothetical protein